MHDAFFCGFWGVQGFQQRFSRAPLIPQQGEVPGGPAKAPLPETAARIEVLQHALHRAPELASKANQAFKARREKPFDGRPQVDGEDRRGAARGDSDDDLFPID